MKKLYIFFSVIVILFIIFLNCQQAGGSSSGGGGGGDDDPPAKWSSQLKIEAFDAADNDQFGNSVSISGDYVIVGAHNEDGGGTGSGAVYIFHRTGTNTWDSVFKIIASDAADNDEFGISVSISGDYAIVGAYSEDGVGITDRGAAYIYHRTGENIWGEEKKITASDAAAADRFGCSVSISGNYAIVGAYKEDGSGTDIGAAYIYRRALDTWDEMTKITASDAADNDWFGLSVSISGEYVIVSARNQADHTGAAYIFHRSGFLDTWVMEAKLVASDAAVNAYFGQSVSISGSYAVVGATTMDIKGAAYIFYKTGAGIWDTGTKVTAPVSADFDQFGCSVSISGDYAIVGAYSEDGGGIDTDRGAAYIFKRTGENTWNNGTRISASDAADADYFGCSVSISGDYAIVGAREEDGSGIVADTDRGAIYIFK